MTASVVVSRIQNRRGTQSQFDSLYPAGYTGVGGVNIESWPNILLPGEIGLCTDTRRIFIGNLNGEYVEVTAGGSGGFSGEFFPFTAVLPPTPVFLSLPGAEYSATPFLRIQYSITDVINPDWNSTGVEFSKNGELCITAIENFEPVLPYPSPTPVSLIDTGVEINKSIGDISFIAQYNTIGDIELLYKHNFISDLSFSSTTIKWAEF